MRKPKLVFSVQLVPCDIPGASNLMTFAGNTFFDLGNQRYLVTKDPKGVLAKSHREMFRAEITDLRNECLPIARLKPYRVIEYSLYRGENAELPLPKITVSDYDVALWERLHHR